MRFNFKVKFDYKKLLLNWGIQREELFWHKWYAWHPVQMPSGDYVWLETVERILTTPTVAGVKINKKYTYREVTPVES